MYYSIIKEQCNWNLLFLDCNKIYGYKFTPKNTIKGAIFVNEMIIVKPDFIKNILKKKVRLMLENLDEESDDGDTRKALDHVQRYKRIVNEKYSEFLDSKYISLLNQKIDILEREFKNNLIIENEIKARKKVEEELQRQYEMQDEIEEKENRRRR